MRSTRKFIFLLLAVCIFACSSRQVYQSSEILPPSPPATININTASADELEKLPHIGRKTAEGIIQFREANGPFRRPEYLMQIHGISENRFLQIRQYIRTE